MSNKGRILWTPPEQKDAVTFEERTFPEKREGLEQLVRDLETCEDTQGRRFYHSLEVEDQEDCEGEDVPDLEKNEESERKEVPCLDKSKEYVEAVPPKEYEDAIPLDTMGDSRGCLVSLGGSKGEAEYPSEM